LTKDVKIVSKIWKSKKTNKITKLGVGDTLGEVDEIYTIELLKKKIKDGIRFETQSYGDADPANVIVRKDGVLTTGKDDTPLNNLSGIDIQYE
jgi:hypothetical protein